MLTQICTNEKQSNRLLKIGLDPKTATMHYELGEYPGKLGKPLKFKVLEFGPDSRKSMRPVRITVPCWDFHSLVGILPIIHSKQLAVYPAIDLHMRSIRYLWLDDRSEYLSFGRTDDLFENIIDCIEWLINDNYIHANG